MNTLAWPMSSENLGTGQVPSSAPQQSSMSSSIQELIQHISSPLDPALVKAATTPIAGQHVAQVPTNLQTPVQPANQGRLIDTRGIVGKKQGKAAGIGNAIIGATNALGAVVQAEGQQKQNQIKDAATKVITAQQAIDEAQQSYDQAKASGNTEAMEAAKTLIDKNTQARDGIFAEPKMRKALVKGFDISYTDPQSNNTEEHKAVQAAMTAAKTIQEKRQIQQEAQVRQNKSAGSAAGSAFAFSQPQTLAPNQIAQAQLSIAQQQKKDLVDMYKTSIPAMVRADASVQTESMRQVTELAKQQNEMNTRIFERNQTFQQRLQILDKTQQFAMKRLFTENSLVIGREQQRLKDLSNDPNTVLKAADESDRTWASAIANQQTQYDTANSYVSDLRSKKADPKIIASAQAELESRQQMLENSKDQADYYQKFYDAKRTLLGLGSTQKPPEEEPIGTGNTNSTGIPDSLSGIATDGWSTFQSVIPGATH